MYHHIHVRWKDIGLDWMLYHFRRLDAAGNVSEQTEQTGQQKKKQLVLYFAVWDSQGSS